MLFPGATLSHVSRVRNGLAHGLARFVLIIDDEIFWSREMTQPILSDVLNLSELMTTSFLLNIHIYIYIYIYRNYLEKVILILL